MFADAQSTQDLVTLVIAVIGAVLGAASLTWNVASFLYSGPRLKVQLRLGGQGPRGIVHAAVRRGRPPNWDLMTNQGYTAAVVGVEVTNAGRASTEIQKVTFALSNGFGYYELERPGNKPLPYRLESHAMESWFLPYAAVAATAHASGGSNLRGWMEVQYAGRKIKRTKKFPVEGGGSESWHDGAREP